VLELKPNHEMMQIQWMSNAPFKQMLEKVWWCNCFRLESCGCLNYFLIHCSKGGRHVHHGRLEVTSYFNHYCKGRLLK
jgi:hypothetical protein